MPNHDNHITTTDFNKFSGAIFDERLNKQQKIKKIATRKALVLLNNALSKMRKKYKNYRHLTEVFLVMMVFKICLFISQHLLCKIINKYVVNMLFLIGNLKEYILLNFHFTIIAPTIKYFDRRRGLQFSNSVLAVEKRIAQIDL